MARSVANATDTYAERVAERGDELAPAERRVAELLLDLGPEATLLSAAALAEQLGTSDATVVRTAKALGYSGLAELRRALAAYGDNPPLGERLRRTLEQTPGDELLAAAIRNHLAALETLTRNVSPAGVPGRRRVLAGARPRRLARRRTVRAPRRLRAAHHAADRQARASRSCTPARRSPTSCSRSHPTTRSSCSPYGRLQSHVRVLLEHAETLDVPVVLITDTLGRKLAAAGARDAAVRPWRARPLREPRARRSSSSKPSSSPSPRPTEPTRKPASTELNELRAALAGRRIDVDTP